MSKFPLYSMNDILTKKITDSLSEMTKAVVKEIDDTLLKMKKAIELQNVTTKSDELIKAAEKIEDVRCKLASTK